jgi:hypothetical protein
VKHNVNSLKPYLIFIPVLLVSLAIMLLGALFVQGYDVGNAIPRLSDDKSVDNPGAVPAINAVEIADTANLPSNMPPLPTPAKQTVIHAMKHKEQPEPQPPRSLPETVSPVAERVTAIAPDPQPSASAGNVAGASDNNGDHVTDSTQLQTQAPSPAPSTGQNP